MKALVFLLAVSFLSGCVSLSRSDEEALRVIKSSGFSEEHNSLKSPLLAGSLNILPGIGNFYLASGTNESSQWTYGFLNLLFWPASVLWGVPQASIDAVSINKKETVYYFNNTSQGKAEMAGRLKQSSNSDDSTSKPAGAKNELF